ncbi:MAG: hypothetical protein ACYSX1_06935 [Planctomycetota bacterium]
MQKKGVWSVEEYPASHHRGKEVGTSKDGAAYVPAVGTYCT